MSARRPGSPPALPVGVRKPISLSRLLTGSHASATVCTDASPVGVWTTAKEAIVVQARANAANVRLTLSVTEAGRLLGIGRVAAYQAVAAGTIPALRLGRYWRVPRAALEKLLEHPPQLTRGAGSTSTSQAAQP